MTNAEYKQLYGEDFDLSEKHLTWYTSTPVTASVDSTQVGEGIHLIGKEGDPNAVYDNGGFSILISTLFSAGVGPVYERSFPYQGKEGLTERQYLAKYPDRAAEPARSNFEQSVGMTYAQAVEHKGDAAVKPTIDKLVEYDYLTEADVASLTPKKLEEAYTKAYAEKLSETNRYTKLDDWSITELAKDGSPNRNVSAGFTLVDANSLPSLMVKDKDKHWAGINEEGVQAVKSELMKGRGVSAAFKADQAAPGEAISKNGYMNTTTWAHYTYEGVMPSHAICIVGWDDNYSASNFANGHQPPGDGAWIVKNSWGSQTDYVDIGYGNHIGEGEWGVKNEAGKHTGYFYISYYDKTLNWCESMTFDTDLFESSDAMSVWAYDYMPSTLNFMEDTTDQSETPLKTANVFTNDMGTGAQINAVSTRTAQPNATVTYSMYLLDEDAANPEDGKLLGTKTATYDYAGFHRESLDGSIVLRDGERLGILAEETVTSDGKTLYEYINNAAKSKAAAEAEGETEYAVAVVNEGESFIYKDGKWTDWSTYEPRTKASDKYAIDNFSIKAYATPTSVDPDKVSMHRLCNPNSGEHFYTGDYADLAKDLTCS